MSDFKNFYEIEIGELTRYEWSFAVKEWVGIAIQYTEATDKLAAIMLENYATPSAFRYVIMY